MDEHWSECQCTFASNSGRGEGVGWSWERREKENVIRKSANTKTTFIHAADS